MSVHYRRISAVALVAALLVGAIGFGAAWRPLPVVHAQATEAAPNSGGSITVIGEGKVSLQPDIARVTIGVETLKDTVQEASADNRTSVEAVLEALKAQGIAEDDIQTSGFSVYAERYGPTGPLPEGEVRYRVSNNVTVTIRDIDSVGTVLDAAVEAGANNIYGVEFALDDPSSVESDAREKAVADARAKAEELAGLVGAELGDVISVSEVIAASGFYAGNFAEQARGLGGGGGAPVMPGQLDLIMQLQISYALAQ
jgi:hypothetical protein